MRAITIRSAILAAATVVAASVALEASAMATHSDSATRAYAVGQRLGGGAFFAHGKLQYSTTIASRLSSLNDALDACYTSHGAPRVSIAGGGWTYQDPRGAAQTACQPQQNAVNAFAGGAEMAGFSQTIRPLVHAFWSCMLSHGIVPPNADDVQVDTQSPAFTAGAGACSAAANSALGVAGP